MYEELQLALMDLITPERLDVFLEAQQLLSSMGLSDFEDEIQQVFGLQDGISDNDLLVSRVETILIYAMGDALNQYGVTVRDDTPLEVMAGIAQATANIEHYVIPEVLHDITLGDWQPEEALAEMVPMFSAVSGVNAFDYLTHVKEDTITRIREITASVLQYRPPEDNRPVDHKERIARINQLLRHTQHTAPAVVVNLAKSGVGSGQPLTSLMNYALEDLDKMNTDEVGIELLGLVYFSNTPLDNMTSTIRDVIQDYTDEYQEQVRIHTAITLAQGAIN